MSIQLCRPCSQGHKSCDCILGELAPEAVKGSVGMSEANAPTPLSDDAVALREAFADFIDSIERAPISWETGVCCCGNDVASHGYGDGHSAVDEGSYFISQAITRAKQVLQAIEGEG